MKKLSYMNHIEHYKKDSEYFNYFDFDKYLVDEIRRRYQEFFSILNPKPADIILEIGSGGG